MGNHDKAEHERPTPTLSGSEERDSPAPPHLWYHIVINTYCSWLHGDPRGFRSRGARIISSDDYKHPPPPGEHADLHRYQQNQSQQSIALPNHLWPIIGKKLVAKVQSQQHRLLAVAVDAHHAHLHVELPGNRPQTKRIIGTWKQAASHAVQDELPGRIWSRGCDPKPLKDQRHHRNAFNYVLRHAEQGAWIWRFDQPDDEAAESCDNAHDE